MSLDSTPDCNRSLTAAGPCRSRLCRQALSAGRRMTAFQRRVGLNPGENVGRSIQFSSTCWLIQHGSKWLLWDTGVCRIRAEQPQRLVDVTQIDACCPLDKTLTAQLATIGLKPDDIAYVALSHTHGDHIGNVGLFPQFDGSDATGRYEWISTPDGPNDNVNQLKALARKLMGTPKHLKLLDGDTDVFGDGSVTLVSTPGHTAGSESLMVRLRTQDSSFCPATWCTWRRILRKTPCRP